MYADYKSKAFITKLDVLVCKKITTFGQQPSNSFFQSEYECTEDVLLIFS